LKGDGVLQPALVIGLGNHGLGILKRLRRELFEQFGTHDALPHVRLLYLDTDPDALQMATGGHPDSALRSAEVLLTRLHRPSHYLKPGLDGQQRLVSWLNPKLLFRMPRQQTSAGLRALGRLAFVDNFRAILRRLQNELESCCSADILQLAANRTGLGVHISTPRVYVATSLAGGTGGGMFLDLAYALRYILKRLGYGHADTVGVFLLPDVDKSTAPTPGLANAFAAMTELNHFAAPNSVFQARYEASDQTAPMSITEVGPPYQRCVLLPLPERRGAGGWPEPPSDNPGNLEPPAAGPLGLAGHFLLTELATPLGLAAQKARGTVPGPPLYQTVGMYRLLWPRRQMVQQAARDLCKRLVQRWMNKDAKPLRESVQRWVEAQWTEQGLTADQLILRLQEDCERTLGQPPENLFSGILAALAPLTPPTGKAAGTASEQPFQPAVVLEAMEELEKLVGIPDECKPSGPTLSEHSQSTLEQAVRQASEKVADECDQRLAELLVRLIEEPAFRLAGAEEAVRQFNTAVEKALDHQEHLGKELHARAVALYQRIHTLLGTAGQVTNTSRQTPLSKKVITQANALVSELLSLIRSYPKCRYQSLVLHNLTSMYVSLRGLLSEQMREIGFCRQRLSELADLFAAGSPTDLVPAAGRCLFASDCNSLRAAVAQLVNSLGAADMQLLDQRIQGLLQKQWRALVHICTASSLVIRNVAPAMQQETEAFLIDRQAGANVADMFLAQPRGKTAGEEAAGALRQELVKTFDQAETALPVTTGREVCILALPPGQGEQAFREATKEALPDVPFAEAASTDEILFYREQVGFTLTDLKQLGSAGREAYHQMTRREQYLPHSRADITDWRAAPATGT
jgi:hypothetical protein